MKLYLKLSLTFAVILLANSFPQGNEIERAPTKKPLRPTRPPSPGAIYALQSTYGALGNIATSAGNLVSSSLDSMANRAYNTAKSVAETTSKLIDNTASTIDSGIHTVAHTLSNTITRPFRGEESTTN